MTIRERDRRRAIVGLEDVTLASQFAQMRAQGLARERFVVGDQNRLVHDRTSLGVSISPAGLGMTKLASNPSSRCCTWSSAADPNAATSRSRTDRKPNWCEGEAVGEGPGPSSRTLTCRPPSFTQPVIQTDPPSGRVAIAWCTAFSTSVCNANGGTSYSNA